MRKRNGRRNDCQNETCEGYSISLLLPHLDDDLTPHLILGKRDLESCLHEAFYCYNPFVLAVIAAIITIISTLLYLSPSFFYPSLLTHLSFPILILPFSLHLCLHPFFSQNLLIKRRRRRGRIRRRRGRIRRRRIIRGKQRKRT